MYSEVYATSIINLLTICENSQRVSEVDAAMRVELLSGLIVK